MDDNLPKSRAEALRTGASYYFTGQPCLNGHISKRTISYNCAACLRSWRTAHRDPVKRRKYYENNKDRENEQSKQYYMANGAKRRDNAREYRKRNAETLRQHFADWRRRNPTYAAEHRQKNRDRYAVYAENRRCRLQSGQLSKDIVAKLLHAQNARCAICSRPLKGNYHLDHITPLSSGGLNIDANVQLTHPKCNCRKGRQMPETFMRTLGLLL